MATTLAGSAVRPAQRLSSAGFPWRLLIVALVVFGLTVLIYAGMMFGYIPYLESQIKDIDSKFTQLSKSLDNDQQQALLDFYSQLYNIDQLSAGHLMPSRFFDFLERNMYPTVKINNLQLNVATGEIRLDGIALDYVTLTNQVALLQKSSDVRSIVLDTSKQRDSKEGGGVTFSLKLNFISSFFTARSL